MSSCHARIMSRTLGKTSSSVPFRIFLTANIPFLRFPWFGFMLYVLPDKTLFINQTWDWHIKAKIVDPCGALFLWILLYVVLILFFICMFIYLYMNSSVRLFIDWFICLSVRFLCIFACMYALTYLFTFIKRLYFILIHKAVVCHSGYTNFILFLETFFRFRETNYSQ